MFFLHQDVHLLFAICYLVKIHNSNASFTSSKDHNFEGHWLKAEQFAGHQIIKRSNYLKDLNVYLTSCIIDIVIECFRFVHFFSKLCFEDLFTPTHRALVGTFLTTTWRRVFGDRRWRWTVMACSMAYGGGIKGQLGRKKVNPTFWGQLPQVRICKAIVD